MKTRDSVKTSIKRISFRQSRVVFAITYEDGILTVEMTSTEPVRAISMKRTTADSTAMIDDLADFFREYVK